MTAPSFLAEVREQLLRIVEASRADDQEHWLSLLDLILNRFECATGTIHRLQPGTPLLHLLAQRGIPDAILDRVRVIPVGKGMAGLAAERREPVQVCNLQTDQSGDAKPAAKQTQMAGSIAVPMLVDGELRGTLGVAKPVEYEFTAAEKELLLAIAAEIGFLLPNMQHP